MLLTLVIGHKNYSSWSLRPWLLLKHLGLEFREIVVPLYGEGFRGEIAKYSPAGRVPVLVDGDIHVWDSFAIAEHLAEKTGRGWPREVTARAQARSVSAEMHSGFSTLRSQCPMNVRARGRRVEQTPELKRDVARIDEIWRDCRQRFSHGGPWLLGDYSIADAMFAPVVTRFNTFGLEACAESRAYMQTVLADPPLEEWFHAAEAETFRNHATEAVGLLKTQA
ncbi:MAG TPA: glutathione S-transferase family protein [Steroidobacteraceae bacterium]|nr:glutathione S-transferase family protein [Steroidobacteraceae bacterium]